MLPPKVLGQRKLRRYVARPDNGRGAGIIVARERVGKTALEIVARAKEPGPGLRAQWIAQQPLLLRYGL